MIAEQHVREIMRLADLKAKALVERDSKVLAGILHEDFRYTNSHGRTYDKKSYIGLFEGSSEMRFISQEYSGLEVNIHGRIAVLEASVADSFTYQGRELQGTFRTMMLFIKELGEWKWLRGITVEAD